MAKGGDGKVSNGLVAASCAAILAVYTAGYARTRDAADRLEAQAQERRPAVRSERTVAVVQPQAPVVPAAKAPERPTEPQAAIAADAPTQTIKEVEAPVAAPAPVATPAPVAAPVAAAPVAVAPTPAPTPAPVAAPAPVATPAPAPPPAPAPKWKDGTYTGWGSSRHGDIEARVVIHEGRIVEAGISQCLTRYSCDVIDRLIPQPVQLQSANIDYVSRATESSDAYYFGLVEALEKASTTPKQAQ